MILNHIHLTVRDLNAAVIWFETVMHLHPGFRNEKMAMPNGAGEFAPGTTRTEPAAVDTPVPAVRSFCELRGGIE